MALLLYSCIIPRQLRFSFGTTIKLLPTQPSLRTQRAASLLLHISSLESNCRSMDGVLLEFLYDEINHQRRCISCQLRRN